MSYKVSVIVPCYGVEAYLSRCLESLSGQSLKELEIIAVDDGSPDNCLNILEEARKEMPHLRVFHKENGGLSDARNFGLERASGEYVAFLDGDDFADPDLYLALYREAKKQNADVVACPIRYVWENKKEKLVSSGLAPLTKGEDLKEAFTRFYPAVWNKLYRKSVLEESGVWFRKGVYFEDVEFSHRLFPYCKTVAAISSPAVNYVQREGSITGKADRKLFDYPKNMETVLSFFRERDLFSTWEKELEFAACRYLLATFLKQARSLSRGEYQEAIQTSLSFLNRHFPHWRRNPYFARHGAKGLYLRFFSPALANLMRGGIKK